MTQAETLRALDASIFASLAGAGIADSATYTPSIGGSGIPCGVYVDRAITLTGAQGQVINDAVIITAFAADIGSAPKPGARFKIGSELFTVESLNNQDESRYTCLVKAGY